MTNNDYDKIYIRDLLCRCIIGINADERNEKQDVIINIILYTDLYNAGHSDEINDSVNYKTIKKSLKSLVEHSSYLLIEKMAQVIADHCLSYSGVEAATVTIDKPGALRFARSVAVEITRTKDQ